MNVRELIEALSTLDQDGRVYVVYPVQGGSKPRTLPANFLRTKGKLLANDTGAVGIEYNDNCNWAQDRMPVEEIQTSVTGEGVFFPL